MYQLPEPDSDARRLSASIGFWLRLLAFTALVAVGVWIFTSSKPNHDMEVQVAYRSVGDEQLELMLRSIDHEGVERDHLPTDNVVYLHEERDELIYSDPVDLPGFAPLARVSVRSESQYDVSLGFSIQRPNRRWQYSRFPSRENLTETERSNPEWTHMRPLAVRVLVHQPLLDTLRLIYYILMGLAVLGGITLFLWRRVLN